MLHTNPALDHFEAPATLEELTHVAVAYLENIAWKVHKNRVVYLVLDLTYADNVSNSHCAPFNKDTNWEGKKDIPRSYPGWQGRIWVGTQSPIKDGRYPNRDISDFLKNIGIHTGTGGSGEYHLPTIVTKNMAWLPVRDYFSCWGWDVKIFLEDWISIKLAALLEPTDKTAIRTFSNKHTHLCAYINSPPDPNKLMLSKHKAVWLSVPVGGEYPTLDFSRVPAFGGS